MDDDASTLLEVGMTGCREEGDALVLFRGFSLVWWESDESYNEEE